jgi:hypothetical protein
MTATLTSGFSGEIIDINGISGDDDDRLTVTFAALANSTKGPQQSTNSPNRST